MMYHTLGPIIGLILFLISLCGLATANVTASPLSTLSFKQYAYNGTAFVFSPRAKKWYAYKNGRLINSGRASGGKHYCPDVGRSCRTPVGHFRVYSKGSASCVSSKYPLNRRKPRAKMPYCMFFRGGYGIHGSYNVPNYNASHGCIRVRPAAARWLHRSFIRHGTRVIVRSY